MRNGASSLQRKRRSSSGLGNITKERKCYKQNFQLYVENVYYGDAATRERVRERGKVCNCETRTNSVRLKLGTDRVNQNN